MGFVIVGVVLFAGAAIFGDNGYTWLVALIGALAVVYGACTIALRDRRKLRSNSQNRGGSDQLEGEPGDAAWHR